MIRILAALLFVLVPFGRAEVVTFTVRVPAIHGDGTSVVNVPPYGGTGTLTSVQLELLATVEVFAATENLAHEEMFAVATFAPVGTLQLLDGPTMVASSSFAPVVTQAGPWATFDGGLDWLGPSSRRELHSYGLPASAGSAVRISRYSQGLVPLAIRAECSTTLTAWGNVALWEELTSRCSIRVTYTAQ